ncbi:MAG TPA: hypothetical protein VHE78_07730 [Gemmatimonadaceae bacterium]|nr:hypothetical protein [Gemmatimonadaceae bacterium]
MRGVLHAVLLAVLTASMHGAGAQAPGLRGTIVTATVEPETLTVGVPFTVRIRVRAPKIASIRFPPVPDSADAIEAVDPRYVEDASDNSVLDRTAVYRLVAWDVGVHRPHLTNVVVSASGVDQAFPVNLGSVVVSTVLPADSASRVPRSAREPVPEPSGLWRYVLLTSLGVLAVAWYAVRRLRHRAKRVAPDPEAFDSANAAFDALDELGLVEAGEPGRHVIAHVDVMRAYVARRFPVARESLTGNELVAALETSDLPMPPARVGALLKLDSGVRYAHAPIAPTEAVALAREARTIVNDVQRAYEARLRTLDKGPSRQRRGKRK